MVLEGAAATHRNAEGKGGEHSYSHQRWGMENPAATNGKAWVSPGDKTGKVRVEHQVADKQHGGRCGGQQKSGSRWGCRQLAKGLERCSGGNFRVIDAGA